MAEVNETSNVPIGKLAAWVAVLTGIVVVLAWVFGVQATAQRADTQSQQNAADIRQKVDREELKEIKQEVHEIRDFLLKGAK